MKYNNTKYFYTVNKANLRIFSWYTDKIWMAKRSFRRRKVILKHLKYMASDNQCWSPMSPSYYHFMWSWSDLLTPTGLDCTVRRRHCKLPKSVPWGNKMSPLSLRKPVTTCKLVYPWYAVHGILVWFPYLLACSPNWFLWSFFIS